MNGNNGAFQEHGKDGISAQIALALYGDRYGNSRNSNERCRAIHQLRLSFQSNGEWQPMILKTLGALQSDDDEMVKATAIVVCNAIDENAMTIISK